MKLEQVAARLPNREDIDAMPGIKQREIQKCAACGKGLMHDRLLTFYRFKVEYLVANIPAIQRQTGLEMMFGGGAAAGAIANAMGPNEDIAKVLGGHEGFICLDCAVNTSIAHLSEILEKRTEEKEPS